MKHGLEIISFIISYCLFMYVVMIILVHNYVIAMATNLINNVTKLFYKSVNM